ncbi:MAG: SRPBCC family protein [Propionibacteriales bacterium]|nr:SRPBCC family protein [Propionibacteriales bacterium]
MITNTRAIEASPDKVWEVLADGWLYPLWVVGATRMRAVDDTWPAVGSKLRHSAGVWPLVIDDNTEVLEVEPGRSLRLRARGWPMGEAEVLITLAPEGSRTRVDIVEDAVRGPGVLVPKFLRHPMIKWRNAEALDRFANLAEGR